MSRFAHRVSNRRGSSHSSARPVEALEDRRLFAVAISHVLPDTLILTGDGADDVVNLNDNGAGVVTGSATNGVGGMTAFGWPGVRKIIVNTGEGNDKVNYQMTGDNLAGGATWLTVELAGGNDAFQFYAGNGIDLGPNAYLDIKASGGKGKDFMWAFYRGKMNGRINLVMDGGEEADQLVTDVKFDPGSGGGFYARSYGGRGNDLIDLFVRKSNPADPVWIDALASGQGDVDTVRHTALAAHDVTCEFFAVVP